MLHDVITRHKNKYHNVDETTGLQGAPEAASGHALSYQECVAASTWSVNWHHTDMPVGWANGLFLELELVISTPASGQGNIGDLAEAAGARSSIH